MPYQRKTLRAMPPTTRKLAKLIAEIDSVSRKLKNLLPVIQRQERDSIALYRRNEHYAEKEATDGHRNERPDQPITRPTVQN